MSPLSKRLPREFRNNAGKYVSIAALLIIIVALVAGYLMAASSITRILDEVDETYKVEDGRFTTNFEMKSGATQAIEELGVMLCKNYSYDLPARLGSNDSEATIRIYENRTGLNLPAYYQGSVPSTASEIALDKVFCANRGIVLGDSVTVAGKTFTLSGIMVLSDYQALFESNSDFVFNAQSFSVAQVSPEAFEGFEGESCTYTYSFLINNRTLDDKGRAEFEEDMLDVMKDRGVTVTDFIDRDANNGIGYAAEDLEGDTLMWIVLLYLLLVVMAFVFVVLTSATIESESAAIGTLLSLGYRKRELIAHYIALPALSSIVGAIVGNVLGYAYLIEAMSGLYYNSYSLPPYHTVWDWGVFVQSTLLPVALLLVITFVGLLRKLRCTPLQFLRGQITRSGRKGGVSLPEKLSFPARFRLRVFLRNASHFATLFVGIFFASLLLLFGFCLMPTVNHYAVSLAESLVAQHTYTLKAPVELAGTPEERSWYAAALELSHTVDLSDIDVDEVEDKLSNLLESRIEEDVSSQLEDLFNKSALTSLIERKAKALFDEEALEKVVLNRIEINAEAIAQMASAGQDVSAFATMGGESLSQSDLEALINAGVVSRWVDLSDYGLGKVDLLEVSSGDAFSSMDFSQLSWSALVRDGIMRSTWIDLSYYGLGGLDLVALFASSNQEQYLEDRFGSLDAEGLNWDALVSAGIMKSSLVDLTRYGLGVVDLATFDGDDISVDDLDFDAMDFSDIDFSDIGLGSVEPGDMTKVQFFKLLVSASHIDEDAHVVNAIDNGEEAIAQAEKFVAAGLQYDRGGDNGYESVTLYGIQPGSSYYTDIAVSSEDVVIGRGLAEKFSVSVGDTISLYNKYENESYDLRIRDLWGNSGNMNAFMTLDGVNVLVGNEQDYFNGYFSNEPLVFDALYLAGDITPADMDKIGAQMEDSMGDMMNLLVGISALIYVILMYLLTKTVIERSARPISYMKVFGYRNSEVNRLYLRSITQVVLVSLVAVLPLIWGLIDVLLKVVFMKYSGNFVLDIPMERIVLEVLIGVACYAVVALLHAWRIRRVPLSLALKVQE